MRGDYRKITVAVARIALLALACAVGGCSTSSLFGTSSKPSDAATSGSSTAAATSADDSVECPEVTVRNGASTLTIAARAAGSTDPTALDLRYQGSIVRTARECRVTAGIMTMKVGIEGRIVLGPAGGPGQLDVPLRLAVVREGPEPKTVLSKLVKIPVTLTSDSERENFTHIDPDVTFPLPKPAGDIDSYVVYVGFDTNAVTEKPRPAAKPKPKAKR
jgi:hypothetical protein